MSSDPKGTALPLTWSANQSAVPADSDLPIKLPMPELIGDIDAQAEQFHYSVASVSLNGRLSDRRPVGVLNWRPESRLAIEVVGRTIIIREDQHGDCRLTDRGHLLLPAGCRHRCLIKPGERVLVAASVRRKLLLVYPMRLIERALSPLHEQAMGDAR
ncbi:hypothetical protein [Nocardia transvalensis]|uniref:hypothetical protein n=1 Tax=Nocardia transvalensis TaxID=37333 RepID=UPI001894C5CB|nr:hypothetical protein [Nocardia transvalensis]MBF6333229.1 hypothetical protein [Nocardia transvalensis]